MKYIGPAVRAVRKINSLNIAQSGRTMLVVSFVKNNNVSNMTPGYTMKCSLSPWKIHRAPPQDFPQAQALFHCISFLSSWYRYSQHSTFYISATQGHSFGAEMEKAYKIAHAKLQVWKISTQNMCKKCPKMCKISKNAQNYTKKTKNI